jgi:ArsR family transcriptional regulator
MNKERLCQQIQEDFRRSKKILLAIGDETRQGIISTLNQASSEGMRVGEITERTYISRPAISHHLKILCEAGLVKRRPKGTMNFYHAVIEEEYQPLFDLAKHIESLKNMEETK